MSWHLQISGHKPDGSDNADGFADIHEMAKELIERAKENGHTIGSHSINGEPVKDVE